MSTLFEIKMSNTLFESNSDQVDLLKRNCERHLIGYFYGVGQYNTRLKFYLQMKPNSEW